MPLIKCYICGGFVSDRAQKCPKCGAPVLGISSNDNRAMPNSELAPTDERTVLNGQSDQTAHNRQSSSQSTNVVPPAPKKSNKGLIFALSAALFALIVVLAVSIIRKKQDKQDAERQMARMEAQSKQLEKEKKEMEAKQTELEEERRKAEEVRQQEEASKKAQQFAEVKEKENDISGTAYNMKAPQIRTGKNGFIELDACPKSFPGIVVKLSNDQQKVSIYYDGVLINTFTDDEAFCTYYDIPNNPASFLDANFDGFVDILVGPGESRSYSSLFVWDPSSNSFKRVGKGEEVYQNITLNPAKKEVITYGGCGALCVGGSFFKINGARIIKKESFIINGSFEDDETEFTIFRGNDETDIIHSCYSKSQLPKAWRDKLEIILDYMWDDLP